MASYEAICHLDTRYCTSNLPLHYWATPKNINCVHTNFLVYVCRILCLGTEMHVNKNLCKTHLMPIHPQ
ncbi:unnamed protein product [Chondrus crispus]|uniref:Uncharacterized protein n=1 Tax=Chondrus crispus TaxID=2769 RepID=R7Q6F1_CHOCR|nr:unnamed protein product [Chondrus crispus]XP_005712828.1 unnamed protein product [Chondrus crispus]CDF32174.1 unnamed protein product [Chondrus crispus]CDF33025.1 unnamed protein product [Chondrus crispus]|eukprot:XP_005711839.1 unnamed protein product [Chondrus crispus]